MVYELSNSLTRHWYDTTRNMTHRRYTNKLQLLTYLRSIDMHETRHIVSKTSEVSTAVCFYILRSNESMTTFIFAQHHTTPHVLHSYMLVFLRLKEVGKMPSSWVAIMGELLVLLMASLGMDLSFKWASSFAFSCFIYLKFNLTLSVFSFGSKGTGMDK